MRILDHFDESTEIKGLSLEALDQLNEPHAIAFRAESGDPKFGIVFGRRGSKFLYWILPAGDALQSETQALETVPRGGEESIQDKKGCIFKLSLAHAHPLKKAHFMETEGYTVPHIDKSEYFDELSDELITLADEEDWCSEFDELMAGLGMKTRMYNFTSSVEVQATFNYEQPGVEVDYAVAKDIGEGSVSVTIDKMEVEGTITVDVTWYGQEDDEENAITSQSIEAAIYEKTGKLVEIDDWEVTSSERLDS